MTPKTFSDLATRAGHGVQIRLIFDTVQFRLGGRTFATLGWPGEGLAVLKLDPRE